VLDVQPRTFTFSSHNRFQKLFERAFPGNSVNAEQSASQYTLVNAPQRQNFTNQNL